MMIKTIKLIDLSMLLRNLAYCSSFFAFGQLIRSSDKSLGEIASECGFCDSNYLSKLFTRKFGISPGKMRRLKG